MTAGRLEGRTALVTGGAAGLGRSHALTLAGAGADVAIFDLGDAHCDAEPGYRLSGQFELTDTVDEIKALGRRSLALTGDVRSKADVEAAVAETVAAFGRLDILVANAGIAVMGSAWEMPDEDWDLCLATNLTGVWYSCRAAIPHMQRQRYGRIILIGSTAVLRGMKGLSAYSATKAGVVALGRVLAVELAEFGVTVNSVCPSTVPAGSGRGLAARHGLDFEELKGSFLEYQAIKTLLEPADISNAILFLVSDEARYVTGVTLPVDGGTSAL